MEKIVLGIETSCDDTSIGILKGSLGHYDKCPEVLSHVSFSQEKILEQWGGVVPEIAARNHLEKITPLLDIAMREASLKLSQIDIVGVTTLPGLLGPLLTGVNAAKTLCLLEKLPLNPVNHLFAHLEAIHLTEIVSYPYIGLLVSGGHSLYIYMESPLKFKILGSTIDDAAGEAFDKGGKLMGLGYPAGRIIDDMAKLGDKNAYDFPIGLKSSGDCKLSYSGLKTFLRHMIEKDNSVLEKENINNLCASYQKAIVDALSLKLRYALEGNNNLPIVVGGGVACNSALRNELKEKYNNVHFVAPKFCTDNGAMIANYALRTPENLLNFPDCLQIDARGRFIKKGKLHESSQSK